MTFENFPASAYYIELISNDSEELGSFTMNEDMRLSAIQIYILKAGAHNPTDSFKLQIYSANGALLAESDSVLTSEFGDIVAGNWFGYVNFTFSQYPIRDGFTYYLKIKPENTTYSEGSRYYAVKLDWPYNINEYDTDSEERGAAMSIAGYK